MNCLFSVLISFLFILHDTSGHGNDQFMICKPVVSVFDNPDNQSGNQASPINCPTPCRAGKRGPPGLQGSPGPKGEPGVADYEGINMELRQELEQIKVQLKCQGGVVTGGNCIRLLGPVGKRVSFNDARDLCSFHGGLLAEIPTEEVYTAVFNYTKRTWVIGLGNEASNQVQVWLGSVYEQQRGVTLRSGESSYIRWFPRYPRSTSGHNRMCLEVPISPRHRSTSNGMFNINAGHIAVPLCQFTLE